MKFVTVCVIVCVIALNFYLDFVNPLSIASDESDQSFSSIDFEAALNRKYDEAAKKIFDAWSTCNKTYMVPFDEAIDLFQNPPWGDQRHVTKEAKCLVDCILRATNVVGDDGLDDAKYMQLIRELRINYTLFETDEKQTILNAMMKRTFRFANNCYAVGLGDPRLRHIYQKMNNDVDKFSTYLCYNLLLSYEQAALNCKFTEDPDRDKCETSHMIMRCIMEDNRKRMFNSPFYPVVINVLHV